MVNYFDYDYTDAMNPARVVPGEAVGFIDIPEIDLAEVRTNVVVPDRGTLLTGGSRLVNHTETPVLAADADEDLFPGLVEVSADAPDTPAAPFAASVEIAPAPWAP